MEFFTNARNFSMGNVEFKTVQGDYHDYRVRNVRNTFGNKNRYSTTYDYSYNDHSTNYAGDYHAPATHHHAPVNNFRDAQNVNSGNFYGMARISSSMNLGRSNTKKLMQVLSTKAQCPSPNEGVFLDLTSPNTLPVLVQPKAHVLTTKTSQLRLQLYHNTGRSHSRAVHPLQIHFTVRTVSLKATRRGHSSSSTGRRLRSHPGDLKATLNILLKIRVLGPRALRFLRRRSMRNRSSGPGRGPNMSFFQDANNFKMDNVSFRNVQGNYNDRRSYNTVNDNSVNNSTVYHQENAKAPIYNGNITGGVNTFSGGSVTYATLSGAGRSKTSPAQMPSQKKKKKSARPPGIYYQEGALAPIHNGDIEGGVNSYTGTNVIYQGRGEHSEGNGSSWGRVRKSRDRHGYGGSHEQGGWHPSNVAYDRQPSGGSYYGGHNAYSPPGSGQYFEEPMSVDPSEYPASEYPSSEYATSQYPESVNPPSTVGSSPLQWGTHRAGTWAPSHTSTSPPPTINTVPPSAPSSSRGVRSPPASSRGSRLPPIREGLRTPSPSIANAYPSPASSHGGQPFEESYTKRTKKKVNNWLTTGSVSDGMENLSLDDKFDESQASPAQFPLTPPASNPRSPYSDLPDTNPFKVMAQEDWRRRTLM
ncbi:hypothetical protein EST38_g9485 [Candolleomyces aberdarensis]|uniref:Uncharacterized protein n=1 Tax=Candolleomyces aberdarensis TaxID=2316362 RepID=A0A4Q2D9V6_9AGAR|nr:hypothetical protein EST38_g9485 [Candolleomyces aberdarensis]